jgi:hypothetical protein
MRGSGGGRRRPSRQVRSPVGTCSKNELVQMNPSLRVAANLRSPERVRTPGDHSMELPVRRSSFPEGSLPMPKVEQIIFYTRPWEVRFHLELARQLKADLPDSLSACTAADEHAGRLVQLDQETQAHLGVGLNLLALAERFLPACATEAEDFIRRHAIVLDSLVTPNTLSISAMYDHFVYWLAGTLANARGGWHFAFVGTALPRGGVLALRSPWDPWFTQGSSSPSLSLEDLREQITSPNVVIEYMKPNPLPPLYRRWRGRARQELANRKDQIRGSYFASFSWAHLLFGARAIRRVLSRPPAPSYVVRSTDDISGVTKGRPFYYVPLHMEPEATILMYSPWLQDQIEMCRLLSQALPVGMLLLVKENPKMHRRRPLSFYRRLERLPGVRLVAPTVPSLDLINAARGVISLAGSACMEAAILGKPSLVFGRPPFRNFLATADLAYPTGLHLGALTEWMQAPVGLDEETLNNNLQRWSSATFLASATPRRNGSGAPETDASEDNVSRYSRFIRNAVAAERRHEAAPANNPQATEAV